MVIKRIFFLVLILFFFLSSLFIDINPVFLRVNKITGIGFGLYWLLFSRRIIFPNYLLRYLLFIIFSICISFIINANWEAVWMQAKTMLQLSVILFFVYNISFSLKLESNLLFLSLFLVVLFILAYFGAFFGLALTETQQSGRITGLTSNANALGFIILYGLIATLYIVESKENYIFRFISNNWYLVFLFFFILLLPTGSRKSFFTLVGIFIFYGIIKHRNVLEAIIKLSMLSLIVFVFFWNALSIQFESSIMGKRIENIETFQRGFDTRKYLYIEALNFFEKHPIFGIGLNNFQYQSTTGYVTHSYYMEILTNTGIIGFTIIFSIYYLMGKRTYSLFKKQVAIDESIFISIFLFITFLMSFGFTYHLSFVHWFVITFIFVFLNDEKNGLQNNEG